MKKITLRVNNLPRAQFLPFNGTLSSPKNQIPSSGVRFFYFFPTVTAPAHPPDGGVSK
jgi:hypothetical protein